MSGDVQNIDEIHRMADEVARLITDRFGGARRGHPVSLEMALRKRGGALPRRLRSQARLLAEADRLSAQPRIARQIDMSALGRAHAALIQHLRPLGQGGRWRASAINVAATLMLGLLILGAIVIWLMLRRGTL